jgi:hypothetical protein
MYEENKVNGQENWSESKIKWVVWSSLIPKIKLTCYYGLKHLSRETKENHEINTPYLLLKL